EVVDLSIEKHADKNTVAVGDHVGYSITVTGSGPARDVTMSDPLPAGPAGNPLNWSVNGPVTGDVHPACAISGAVGHPTLSCSSVAVMGAGADFSTPQSYSVHVVSSTDPNGTG